MVVPIRRITAKVDAPQVVEVPKGSRSVSIPVRTELTNTGEDDLVLHVPTADHKVFWHVLDEEHQEILRERPMKAIRPALPEGAVDFHSLTIAGGHSEHETETLVVDAAKLKDGHTYTVRAEIWGQIAEQEFVAIRTVPMAQLTPARASRSGKGAAGKKTAAAKGKASKSRTARGKKKESAKKGGSSKTKGK